MLKTLIKKANAYNRPAPPSVPPEAPPQVVPPAPPTEPSTPKLKQKETKQTIEIASYKPKKEISRKVPLNPLSDA